MKLEWKPSWRCDYCFAEHSHDTRSCPCWPTTEELMADADKENTDGK